MFNNTPKPEDTYNEPQYFDGDVTIPESYVLKKAIQEGISLNEYVKKYGLEKVK